MSDYIVWKSDYGSLLVEFFAYPNPKRMAEVQGKLIKEGYYIVEIINTNTSLFIRFEKADTELETNLK